MTKIQVQGQLLDPTGDVASNIPIHIACKKSIGSTLKTSDRHIRTDSQGNYNFELVFGVHVILARFIDKYEPLGTVVINGSTNSPSTIVELIEFAKDGPPDPSWVEYVKELTERAETAVANTSNAANESLTSSQLSESYKNEAKSYRDQASEIAGLDDVAAAIALLSPANLNPDVYIPFNNSLQIVRGYGTHDQIDVSAAQDGSVIVDLPSKSVDFSRASRTGNINKSGLMELLDDDEPAFTSTGLSIYERFTNYIEQSNGTQHYQIGIADNASANDGYIRYIEDTGTSQRRLREDGKPFVSTNKVTVGVTVKPDKNRKSIVLSVSGLPEGVASFDCDLETRQVSKISSAGNLIDFDITEFSEGEYQIRVRLEPNDLENGWSGTAGSWIFFSSTENAGNHTYTGDGISGIEIKDWVLVPDAALRLPPLPTQGEPATRSSDIPSIATKGNMPRPGGEFTLMFEFAYNGDLGWLLETNATRGLGLYVNDTGSLVGRGVSTGDVLALNCFTPGKKYKIHVTYEDGVMTGFVNGVRQLSTSLIDVSYHFNQSINIGQDRSGNTHLNSQFKDFYIVHRVLTDDEIKANGGPKS